MERILPLRQRQLHRFCLEKLQSFWQRGFFDHLIRKTERRAQNWDYVRENPVRAGLMSTTKDWPFQGEIVEIDQV
jgi:hypothetical protein